MFYSATMQTRTYRKWASMLQRCYNPKHPAYSFYGGRGIGVCDRWRHSFQNFQADMGEAPEGLTLDRIDGSKGYEPENCRWATWKEQAANRKPRQQIVGSLRWKCRQAGRDYHQVYQRIKILCWPEEKALEIPTLPVGGQAGRKKGGKPTWERL